MKKSIPAWIVLGIITLVAGLLLGMTNDITAPKIAEGAKAAEEASKQALIPEADSFRAVDDLPADGRIAACYAAEKSGETIGYVVKIVVKGYGGEVEILAGFDTAASCKGITVGGPNFSETSGLGAKAKEPKFTEQFNGKELPLELNGTGNNAVSAITSATITSRAVVGGVNEAGEFVKRLCE